MTGDAGALDTTDRRRHGGTAPVQRDLICSSTMRTVDELVRPVGGGERGRDGVHRVQVDPHRGDTDS